VYRSSEERDDSNTCDKGKGKDNLRQQGIMHRKPCENIDDDGVLEDITITQTSEPPVVRREDSVMSKRNQRSSKQYHICKRCP